MRSSSCSVASVAVPAFRASSSIFNFAIGNSDAHGKNFALASEPLGLPHLAPLYDLVSTHVVRCVGAQVDAARTEGWHVPVLDEIAEVVATRAAQLGVATGHPAAGR